MTHWAWDPRKNRINKSKHKISFETASLVFADPLALSRIDMTVDEERWQTIGSIGGVLVFVVHTGLRIDPMTGAETGRLISARKATSHERKAYEEGDI